MPCLSSSAWLGTPSVGLENKIKASVEKCFFAVKQRVIFTSRPLLPAIENDVLPALLLSNVVYNFSCHCDCRYIARTSQRLQDRIRQHVPKFIRTSQIPNSRNISSRSGKSLIQVMFSESAINKHFLDNRFVRAKNYRNEKFTILSFIRLFFHLSTLKVVYSDEDLETGLSLGLGLGLLLAVSVLVS